MNEFEYLNVDSLSRVCKKNGHIIVRSEDEGYCCSKCGGIVTSFKYKHGFYYVKPPSWRGRKRACND